MIKEPTFEKLAPDFGSSLLVRQHSIDRKFNQAVWHFHPEIELVYVNKGSGKCHIGNHLSYFNNSQLVLIGANLPHHGFTDRLTTNGKETVVQFKEDIFGKEQILQPELLSIYTLFKQAKKGIIYGIDAKQEIGSKIELLQKLSGFDRMLVFLEIIYFLANTKDYTLLNVDGFAFETTKKDSLKIDIIYSYINKHFQRSITLEEIAFTTSMTVPSFCRFFKKATGKTFTEVVNTYRVVHATKLLSESELSITDICYECGFNSFSHFNKHFKVVTGKTALTYRKEIKLLMDVSKKNRN